MQLGNGGTAFLPDGGSLPGGPYQVYCTLDVTKDGAARGEVHFLSEPKYPRPIASGKEFDLHVPLLDSITGDNVVLRVRFVDDSGSVAGYVHGSLAQFRPDGGEQLQKSEDAPMNPRDVFVIHGRDERLRAGMFDFLRSLGLNPMEWSHAVELTGKGAPYVGEVLDAAFSHAQAVVVLFSPDDLAKLRPELCAPKEPAHETSLTPQARPNVLFESGMAMARHPERTILVEIGRLRPFSDVAGRHAIRMDNSPKKRNELAARLKTAGCPVNLTGTDWQTTGDMKALEVRPDVEPSPSEAQTGMQTIAQTPARPVAAPYNLEELLKDPLQEARRAAGLQGAKFIYLCAAPEPTADLEGIFGSQLKGVRRLVEHPPVLRSGGWDIETGTPSQIVKGKLLRTVAPGRKVLELHRNGVALFSAKADQDFLCWGSDTGRIHPTALIETALNFLSLYRDAIPYMRPQPDCVHVVLGMANLQTSPMNHLVPYGVRQVPFLSNESGALPPENVFQTTLQVPAAHFVPEKTAYALVKEVYLWFGYEESKMPYVLHEGDTGTIDVAQLTSV